MAFHTTERGAGNKRQVQAPEWIERDIREAQGTKRIRSKVNIKL